MNSPASRPIERVAIATRRSRLALWQAEHVKQRLEALYPGLSVELLPLSTRGDELLEVRLDKAGGKGGEHIIVSEFYFINGNRIVFINEGDNTVTQESEQRVLRIDVSQPVRDIISR